MKTDIYSKKTPRNLTKVRVKWCT